MLPSVLQFAKFSDAEILNHLSTSPNAEGPNFVPDMKNILLFILKNPDWRAVFPNKKALRFVRTLEPPYWNRI